MVEPSPQVTAHACQIYVERLRTLRDAKLWPDGWGCRPARRRCRCSRRITFRPHTKDVCRYRLVQPRAFER